MRSPSAAGLRGRGGRSLEAVRRGSTRAGRRPRDPACASRWAAPSSCRSTTARSTPRWRSSSSTSCPTPTWRSPSCVASFARGVLAAACGTTAGGMEMLRRLWDAAARLDPSVVGQDEATMPLGRPGGLARSLAARGSDRRRGTAASRRRPGSTTSTTTGSRSSRVEGPAGVYVAAPVGCRSRRPARQLAASVAGAVRPHGHGLVGARHQPGLTASGRVRTVRRAGTTTSPGPSRSARWLRIRSRLRSRRWSKPWPMFEPGVSAESASAGSSRAETQPSWVAALATMCPIGVTMCELPK